MSKGPCLCGDPECWSCGSYYGGPDPGEPEEPLENRCSRCGKLLKLWQSDEDCPECAVRHDDTSK